MQLSMASDGSRDSLTLQRLAAAIHRGDCAAASTYLDDMVGVDDRAREIVERGRTSREARP